MAPQSLLDVDHLDRYVAGDTSLRDEILQIFEEQAALWTRTLDPKLEDAAWRDAAHALKGASRGVGAWEVGDICATAEALVGDNRNEAARAAALGELVQAVSRTIAEVRRLRAL